jgi:hypothetical protein
MKKAAVAASCISSISEALKARRRSAINGVMAHHHGAAGRAG